MPAQPATPPEVFVSYSHVDEDYKVELVKQLNILAQQKVISCWHDGLLVAGQRWNDEIVKQLQSSNIILLLISSDFLNSVYINNVELEYASKGHQAGQLSVIPVLVRNVHSWKKKVFGSIKLGDLQALPSNAKFIKQWKNRDEAFTDVAAGIQKAVEELGSQANHKTLAPPSSVPTSHPTDYVRRHDEKGNDILERLKLLLAPGKKGPVALWGKGGTGKTRIAAEAASALIEEFRQRIVWASAEKSTDFTLTTLLDEIARQLGQPELLKLAQKPKQEAVRELIALAPALIVLDNFETVAPEDERASCVDFLAVSANCPSLITSRQKVATPARNIPIKGMSNKEAQEFLDQLIEQTQDSGLFTKQIRNRIIKTAEFNPYIMLWMVAQIDEAQTPKKVLDELEQGTGKVAERVFERSFTLPQVGSDGRDALLALSLFVPNASREALAEVAGFGDDLSRMDEAAKNLRTLWLIGSAEENERLAVEGLTRSLAKARFSTHNLSSKDDRSSGFRRRFVAYFRRYVEEHKQPMAEDYEALEAEKDNILSAIDMAFEIKDWGSVLNLTHIMAEPVTGMLSSHGYWDETVKRNEQRLNAARQSGDEREIARAAHCLAVIHHYRGELTEAKKLYTESTGIRKKLNDPHGIALMTWALGSVALDQGDFDEAKEMLLSSLATFKTLEDKNSAADVLHQLGKLAQNRGETEEAQRLYNESLKIYEGNARRNAARTLHELGRLAASRGDKGEARRLYNESLKISRKVTDQVTAAYTSYNLGLLLAEDSSSKAEAAQLFREALGIFKKLKSPHEESARQELKKLEAGSS